MVLDEGAVGIANIFNNIVAWVVNTFLFILRNIGAVEIIIVLLIVVVIVAWFNQERLEPRRVARM